MLKQRIITAVLLLAVLLPALFNPSIEPFAALTLLLIVAGGWEWARLNGCGSSLSLGLGLGLGVLMAVVWWAGGLNLSLRPLWLAVGAAWVLLAVVMLGRGVKGWSAWPVGLRLWVGLALIACAWLAMVHARLEGLGFLLSVLLLVWTADIAAYFGGKALGGASSLPPSARARAGRAPSVDCWGSLCWRPAGSGPMRKAPACMRGSGLWGRRWRCCRWCFSSP